MLYGPVMASSLEKIQLAGPPEPELSRADLTRRRVTLLLVAGGAFVATLDLFIVNIAFDTIREHFSDASPAKLSWVLNAYGIVFAALLVPAGKMADRFGRRRLFRLGMAIFATGGILCALSPSVETLIAFRAFEAIGGALMTPTSLGLLLAAYPVERHRTIISWWSAITTTAAALGPPIGGLLVSANWRLIFVINLPIALAVILFGRVLPDDIHQKETGLPDFLGAGLLAVGIASGVAAISNASKWGTDDPKLWLCLALCAGALVAFFVRCGRIARPVVDLALLRVRQFGAANGALILFGAGFAGILLGGPAVPAGRLALQQRPRGHRLYAGPDLRHDLRPGQRPTAHHPAGVGDHRLPMVRRRLAVVVLLPHRRAQLPAALHARRHHDRPGRRLRDGGHDRGRRIGIAG